MTDLTLFIGLDVHKTKISVALADGAAGASEFVERARPGGTNSGRFAACAPIEIKEIATQDASDEGGIVQLKVWLISPMVWRRVLMPAEGHCAGIVWCDAGGDGLGGFSFLSVLSACRLVWLVAAGGVFA